MPEITKSQDICDYFKVLRPRSTDERDSRDAKWALENREAIQDELKRLGPPMWYSKIEVVKDSGIFTQPNQIDNTEEVFFRSFGYEPTDLAGKRVLDIGAFSGGMSFFAEDCGAQVVALDIQNPHTNGFAAIHDIRRSTVMHVTASVYDIHPDLFGMFDVVVFSGVHYHFKHPLLALERVSSVMKHGAELLALGTAGDYWLHTPSRDTIGVNLAKINLATPDEKPGDGTLNEIPLMAFYKTSYMNDDSNWFVPNTLALADMISASGCDIVRAETFPIFRESIKAPIACALVKATKVREPKQEYSIDVYSHLRRPSASGAQSLVFEIPTWYELEKEKRRIR